MPCDTRPLRREETLAQRMERDKQRLRALEQALLSGLAKFKIGPTGSVAIEGWSTADRDGITDLCAFRTLRAQNSWAARQALAKAEAQGGRRLNEAAVAAGHHAHGGDWHKGH